MSRNLQSVAQFAASGAFTQNQLRWWIFQSAHNGLADSGAIVRVQRRIYIDVDLFDAWVTDQNIPSGAAPRGAHATEKKKAVPVTPETQAWIHRPTLRDEFAIAALNATLLDAASWNASAGKSEQLTTFPQVARECYRIADALMEARK